MIPRHTPLHATRNPAPELEFKQILVPVDFSEHSHSALLYAVSFAKRFNARLLLLHVLKSVSPLYDLGRNLEIARNLDQQLRARSQQKLRDFAAKAANASVEVDCQIRTGNPVEEIAECAKEQNIDLIITATHGRTGLKHVFLGSVAEGTIRYSPCPVLVTRNLGSSFSSDGGAGLRLRKILVALDFSETSELALDYAEPMAIATGAGLMLTHVAPIHYPISEYGVLECPQLDAELMETGERHLHELERSVREKDISVQTEIRQGNAGTEVVEAANKHNVDLIVLGTRGLTGLKHSLLGSTAEYVMRHANCPVLTVRARTAFEGQPSIGPTSAKRNAMELFSKIVSTHPFLQELPVEYLETVLKNAKVAEFAPGEILFKEGEYADKFFLIHEGLVAIECHGRDRDIPVQTLGAGEVFGWSWLFPPFAWHFQARAVEQTTVLQLEGAHILIASESDDKFGHQMMKRIAQVLIIRLQETRKRLVEQCEKTELGIGDTL